MNRYTDEYKDKIRKALVDRPLNGKRGRGYNRRKR
tara:strand:- start:673 stop:777 length:105 start_codon:yes stop_codon:yes gene_type:complete